MALLRHTEYLVVGKTSLRGCAFRQNALSENKNGPCYPAIPFITTIKIYLLFDRLI